MKRTVNLAAASAALCLVAAAFAQPANDNCADAIAVANHSSTPFDLTGATRDGLFSCNNHVTAMDIWYIYTAAGPETVTVDLCGSQAASKGITVFAGSCSGTELACSRTSVCGPEGQPRVIFNAPAAGQYVIAVSRRGSSTALTGFLNVNAVPFVPLAGDTCADAIGITAPGSYEFDSSTANTDDAPGACNVNGRPDTHDMYFRYTAPADGWVRFDTLQNAENPSALPTLNTTLQVFDGCGGTLLSCNDDVDYTGAAFGLRVGSQTCPLHVAAGGSYIVRVATSGAGTSGGRGVLRVSAVAGPITYNRPANAIPEPGPECDDDYASDVNYGCNPRITPTDYRTTPIQLCETRTGHIYARTTPASDGVVVHDFDDYSFTIDAPQTVRIVGQSQFVGLVSLASAPCGTGTVYTGYPGQDMNPECGAAEFDIAWDIGPGTYRIGFGVAPLSRPVCGVNNEYWFTITGSAPCPGPCVADLGAAGGLPGSDGLLDNNDFIAFINYFFDTDAHADLGVAGGLAGQDGQYDNNDFIAFINAFFTGC